MPTFVGFNTINIDQRRTLTRTGVFGGSGTITTQPRIGKKFKLVDQDLVIRDFMNSMGIKQGEIAGNPGYGSTLWNYVFEPNTPDIREKIVTEVRRLANLDPRINLNTIEVYSQNNGMIIQLEIAVNPFNNAVQLGFFLNRFDGSIQQLAQ